MLTCLTRDLILNLIGFSGYYLVGNPQQCRDFAAHAPPKHYPLVSILVPARDEEKNIAGCVHSLLAQDYPSFEVLVLDDHPTDATPLILARIAVEESRLVLASCGWRLPAN